MWYSCSTSVPKVRLVDALHPLLLKFLRPRSTESLRRMKLARETDVVGKMVEDFHADFVLCDLPTLNAELAASPRARLLYRDPAAPVALYALGPATHPELVNSL